MSEQVRCGLKGIVLKSVLFSAKRNRMSRDLLKYSIRIIRISLCCIGLGITEGLLLGQLSGVPPPGDPDVFGIFLRLSDVDFQLIQKLKGTDPQSAQTTERVAAARLKLSLTDYAVIEPVYQSMKNQLDALSSEVSAYTNHGKRMNPDWKLMEQFEDRRKQILNSGVRSLQASMTPQGWTALRAYVDGEFRMSIRRESVRSVPVGVLPPGTTGARQYFTGGASTNAPLH